MTSGRDVPGLRIGGFRVLRELARGGMGVVYEVEREETGGRFALKTLLPSLTQQDPELVARFVREARLAARLDHPHVVRTHTADLEGPSPWLVQDLLPGGSLADLLRARGGQLPVEEAVAIGRKVALGLAHAHERGVLHRDVKPSNVLLDADGEPRLVDFGLARRVDGASRLSLTGQLLGSPAFMAPEQALGDPVDARTDVYGAGALLYTLLAGEPPFQDTGTLGVLEAVISRAPPPLSARRPDVPTALEAVVLRALAKRPGERFPDALALAAALEPAFVAAPGSARGGSWLSAAAGLAACLAAAALLVAYARRPTPLADDRSATPVVDGSSTDAAPAERPSEAPPPAPAPAGWASTFERPGDWRLTWNDRLRYAGGVEEHNLLELTLAFGELEPSGDRATLAATISALRFDLRGGLARYDSSDPAASAGFDQTPGGGELVRAVLSTPLLVDLDPRTGAVEGIRGYLDMGALPGSDDTAFVDPTTREAVPVKWPASTLIEHVSREALRIYLENVLHVFPADAALPGTLDARVWCARGSGLRGKRRVEWLPGERVLRGALRGESTLLIERRSRPLERGLVGERVLGQAHVDAGGRIVRSTLDLEYEDASPEVEIGLGAQRVPRRRHGTFELVRLAPAAGGD